MSDNLQYFMETSYKATGSDILKVKIISHACYNTFADYLYCFDCHRFLNISFYYRHLNNNKKINLCCMVQSVQKK